MTELLDLHELSVRIAPVGLVVDGVSLALGAGATLGLVGESGAGKSMTARAIAGLLPPAASRTGTVTFGGVPLSPRARADGFRSSIGTIFQDARSHLDPRQRIGDFLLEPFDRAERRAAERRALELLDRVGLTEPRLRLTQYPHHLSGGMLQRVMIASVVLTRPSLILADEPTTALDVTTQAEVITVLDELRRENGTAMIFITHDLDLAAQLCDRIAVLYAGAVQELRATAALASDPLHPYTRALFVAQPSIDTRVERLAVIPGNPIAAYEAGLGCSFAPRCPDAVEVCRVASPRPTSCRDGEVRCHVAVRRLAEATV